MGEQEYFKEALSDFAYDMACGGAIRHLADLGYSVGQIVKRLDFPAPYPRVQQVFYRHLCDQGVLLDCEPGTEEKTPKVRYVREYNQYGKASFRRVTEESGEWTPVLWKEKSYSQKEGAFLAFLQKKVKENGAESSYVSCDFGIRMQGQRELAGLSQSQRAYIEDIPWEGHRMYHRLDARMAEIAAALYEQGAYEGICYFLKTGEKIRVDRMSDRDGT